MINSIIEGVFMSCLMLRRGICVLMAPVLFFSAQYVAAGGASISLEQSWGLVLVDQGQGYENVHDGVTLSESDRLLTMESSGGTVVYEGGCTIQLIENSVLALDSVGGCGEREVAFRQAGPYYAAAIGIVRPKTTSDAESLPEKSPVEDVSEGLVAQEESAKPVAAKESSSGGISKRAIAIGAGVAALLAAVGGGGGSSSTPQH